MVFVHGFPFAGAMWEPQLADLPPGWRGFAPDLRGFGRSSLDTGAVALPSGDQVDGGVARPDEVVLTMERHADDLARLIRANDAAPAVVCGLSMGGYVAFALRRRHPRLVRALVLADTRAEADTPEGIEGRRGAADAVRDRGAEPIAESMLPKLVAPDSFERRPDVVQLVRSMMASTAPETLIAALAGMAARADSTPDLPGIDVPTVVVVGEHDAITDVHTARAMAEAIPGATLAVIPGAGHVSNLEDPSTFNSALKSFLGRLEG